MMVLMALPMREMALARVLSIILLNISMLIEILSDSSRSPGGYRSQARGSPPPPPPPPSGCAVYDGKPRPPPPAVDWTSFLMVLSYLIIKFNLRRKAKESADLQHLTLDGLSSTDDGSPTPVGLSWDSLDDLFEDEFTSRSFLPSATMSAVVAFSPPPSSFNIQNASGARTVATSHDSLPTSPNILSLHENIFCSINDKPTLIDFLMLLYSMLLSVMKFAVLSILVFVVGALHSLFTVFVCGTAAWVVSFVTQSGFDHEAEPEDIDGASVSDNNSVSRNIYMSPAAFSLHDHCQPK